MSKQETKLTAIQQDAFNRIATGQGLPSAMQSPRYHRQLSKALGQLVSKGLVTCAIGAGYQIKG